MKPTKQEILIGLLWILWIVLSFSANASDGDFAYRVKTEYTINSVEHSAHGTACAITAHTLCTAAHVVQGADEIFIDHEIGWLRCKVVKIDTDRDVAILECKSVELKFITMDTKEPHIGEHMTLWASVLGTKITAIAGTLRTIFDNHHKFKLDVNGFDHGASGGPVVVNRKLVAMTVAGVADIDGTMRHDSAVCLPADRIQYVIDGAPTIAAPETKAEIVELPTPKPKTDAIVIPTEFPHVTLELPRSCKSGKCRAVVKESLTARTIRNCRTVAPRHWDSDADGHGQGGWVNDYMATDGTIIHESEDSK